MAPVLTSHSPQRPSTVVGEFPVTPAESVGRAVLAAREAAREWASLAPGGRAAALAAAARDLRDRAGDAARLIVEEVGKPAAEANAEVGRAAAILDYYAQACLWPIGEQLPPTAGGLLYVERRPWGVAGLITPWNFPIAIPAWKAAPALACGNAVVLKPSPESPACAEFLAGVMNAHLPEGLLAVVHGDADTGSALLQAADVVSFTGSRAVGRRVALAAAGRGVPAQCEMGGQNAAIVLPDCDAQATAAMVAGAAMGYAGQKCTATSRVIVVGENAPFVEALAAAVEGLAPCPPEQGECVVGPLISEAARTRMATAAASATSDGARILSGGDTPDLEGWYHAPTLIDGLPSSHPLVQEETFGPLTVVQHAADLGEAVAQANGVPYGLVTSVHGHRAGDLLAAARDLDAGMIKLNAPTAGVDFHAPFGGAKESSYGPREQGTAALEFYSSTRTITFAAPA